MRGVFLVGEEMFALRDEIKVRDAWARVHDAGERGRS